ncbi:MAG: mobile mystery protein A [Pseudorhodobacter sp.]|nr:mobile mystery protein A [Frankiaceae bacterium]
MVQMKVAVQRAARRALDRRVEDLQELRRVAATPRKGWVRAIREGLGMSAADLATRLGISESSVLSLERNEVSSRARLETLERAADALGCDLVYAFVPRETLTATVRRRAQQKATRTVHAVHHSMLLEDQGLSGAALQEQLDDQVAVVLARPGLWRDG